MFSFRNLPLEVSHCSFLLTFVHFGFLPLILFHQNCPIGLFRWHSPIGVLPLEVVLRSYPVGVFFLDTFLWTSPIGILSLVLFSFGILLLDFSRWNCPIEHVPFEFSRWNSRVSLAFSFWDGWFGDLNPDSCRG